MSYDKDTRRYNGGLCSSDCTELKTRQLCDLFVSFSYFFFLSHTSARFTNKSWNLTKSRVPLNIIAKVLWNLRVFSNAGVECSKPPRTPLFALIHIIQIATHLTGHLMRRGLVAGDASLPLAWKHVFKMWEKHTFDFWITTIRRCEKNEFPFNILFQAKNHFTSWWPLHETANAVTSYRH